MNSQEESDYKNSAIYKLKQSPSYNYIAYKKILQQIDTIYMISSLLQTMEFELAHRYEDMFFRINTLSAALRFFR